MGQKHSISNILFGQTSLKKSNSDNKNNRKKDLLNIQLSVQEIERFLSLAYNIVNHVVSLTFLLKYPQARGKFNGFVKHDYESNEIDFLYECMLLRTVCKT